MREKQTCLFLGVEVISQDFCSVFKNLAYFSNKSHIGAAILKVVLAKTKKKEYEQHLCFALVGLFVCLALGILFDFVGLRFLCMQLGELQKSLRENMLF